LCKCETWSAPPCEISLLSANVSPLQGENPIFGPLSKNNTGMAALHTGLPVIKVDGYVFLLDFCTSKIGAELDFCWLIFLLQLIIIIIIIVDLYSAFRSEDTEALDAAQED